LCVHCRLYCAIEIMKDYAHRPQTGLAVFVGVVVV
jgi:hypothetical protein